MNFDEMRFRSTRSRALLVLAFMFIGLVMTVVASAGFSDPEMDSQIPAQKMRVLVPVTGIDLPTPTPTLPPPVAAEVGVADTSAQANCTYPSQFWASNPDVWLTENLVASNLVFSKQQALRVLQEPEPDVVGQVLKQFLAAALNILHGADARDVDPSLNPAAAWLNANYNNPSISPETADLGAKLAAALESYNNGLTGPGLCSDSPPPPTPQPTATLTPTPTNIRLFIPLPTRTPKPTSKPGGGGGPAPTAPRPTTQPQPTSPPQPTTQPQPTNPPEATSPPEPTNPGSQPTPKPTKTPKPPKPG